jgi:cytochrome c peroxidase
MARTLFGIVAAAWLLALGAGVVAQSAPQSAPTQASAAIAYEWPPLPPGVRPPPVPADNPLTVAKVELGRHLFYDDRLSGNGTQSCATCHVQTLAFTDGKAQSVGSTGETHSRSSMSLVNVGYATALTWADASMNQLEPQALVPMYGVHPVELGLDRADTWLAGIERDPIYQRLFPAAFPEDARPFTASKRGEVLFHSRPLGCFFCHGGTHFSEVSVVRIAGKVMSVGFHNTGLYNLAEPLSYPSSDTGLHKVTQRREDVGKFKSPTLRNIAVTAPYMHDGSIETLDEVIDHYAAGGRTIKTGPYQGDGSKNPNKTSRIRGFPITPEQKADLIAFLRSLTDEALLKDPKFANPRK